jgi:oxygen-dependent protoporphyrinogen oxidase
VTVAIVGGGIAGLALAWHLRAAGRPVVVFEAADRPGGVVRTLHLDGARIEQGPQSLRAAAGASARLVAAVGLAERVVAPSAEARRRFVVIRGVARPLPTGPLDLLRGGALPLPTLLRALAEPLVPARRALPGPGAEAESVAAFFARRFGAGVANPLLDAFIAGIYAGDATRTEAAAAFPELVAAEREAGSVLLAMLRRPRVARPAWLPRVTYTFREGVEELVAALAAGVGDALRLGAPVERVEVDDYAALVHVGGASERFDRVVVAVPPGPAARLVPEVADLLAGIPCAPVAAVHLGWPTGEGPPARGFGWLAPSGERRDVLGAIGVSTTFPHLAPGLDVVRVMIGGVRAPELARRPDEALVEAALAAVREIQGPCGPPSITQIARHEPGIPQYEVGHGARVAALAGVAPRLHWLGWGYTGIGLSQGLAAAEALAAEIVGGPAGGSGP